MSGSLAPCIPLQFYLKYNPPKITLVYHFVKQEHEQFYHDILLSNKVLETTSEEDLCSQIYLTEAYYFDPKKIKRQQVRLQFLKALKLGLKQIPQAKVLNSFFLQIIGLLRKLKNGIRIQAQKNEGASEAAKNPLNKGPQHDQRNQRGAQEQGKKPNFLDRKGINYDLIDNYEDDFGDEGEKSKRNEIAKQQENFEDDPIIQNRAPSHSPQQDLRKGVLGSLNQKQEKPNHQQQEVFQVNHPQNKQVNSQLPHQQQSSVPPIKDAELLNFDNDFDSNFESQNNQYSNNEQQNQDHGQNSSNKVSDSNGSSQKKKNPTYDDLFLDLVEEDPFSSQNQVQPQNNEQFNQQLQDQNDQKQKQQQPQYQLPGPGEISEGEQFDDGSQQEETEGGDNKAMRRIQIEGEDEEYQMDEQGNIYNLNGDFIGVANPDEIEELNEYGTEGQEEDQ